MNRFVVGRRYTRRDVLDLLGLDDPGGGNWYTGLASHAGEWFIFCGVGTPGRTGHDYDNHFTGKDLVWYAKTGSKISHTSIKELISAGAVVNVFYRESDREPFTYAGRARAKEVEDLVPVRVTWAFADTDNTLL